MDERLLIKQCLQNNRKAQLELYNSYSKAMLGLCYRYMKSLQGAEDALQEGFVKVFTKLNQYDNKGEFGAWVRRIMVTTCINNIQKESKFKYDIELESAIAISVSNVEPEVNLNMKELVELIRKLPANYQTIFNMAAIEGFSQVEISEILDININTVRSTFSRARAMLIKALAEDEINEKSISLN